MKQLGDNRCPFHVVDAIFGQPVKAFEEKQDGEEGHKAGVEFVTEDGERQTCIRHGKPTLVHQMLQDEKKCYRWTEASQIMHEPRFLLPVAGQKTPSEEASK